MCPNIEMEIQVYSEWTVYTSEREGGRMRQREGERKRDREGEGERGGGMERRMKKRVATI